MSEMKRVCRHYDCKRTPTVRVQGAQSSTSPGWSGDYCREHAVSCVEIQLFQVEQGMPITISAVES